MAKRFFSLLFIFSFISNVYSSNNDAVDRAVDRYLESLPLKQCLAQLFLVNIQGDSQYSPVEYTEDKKPVVPGGCLFFNYNIASTAEGVIDFTSSIADYCDSHGILRPYIAIDQEGGYVNRLRNLTVSLPSNHTVADNYSASKAYELYLFQAKQMNALGFDMNLAPVTESLSDFNREFLDNRSYGDKVRTIVYSLACINAYKEGKINCIVKHFPGNTNVDPHSGLPEISMQKAEVYEELLLPFFLVTAGNPVGVLMSHAKIKGFGDSAPACLSKFWCTDILRNDFCFEGLIVSDDIFMAALQKNGYSPDKAAVMAIEAGVNIIMLSEKKFLDVLKVLEAECKRNSVFNGKVYESARKVILYKINAGILSLEKDANGSERVVSVSIEKQLGSKQQRLSRFEQIKHLYKEKF